MSPFCSNVESLNPELTMPSSVHEKRKSEFVSWYSNKLQYNCVYKDFIIFTLDSSNWRFLLKSNRCKKVNNGIYKFT